ncbi:hypothetical protein [Dysgonomonas sp. ZJ279]|uniref:hypothetical protein n=1 Tax=Dysgonomonas sp. ZJ279 TaxID=2709796 RepID=UPI0013EBD45C|nr:hypothetical protein [Dysgonomonas sp. ZJ279]
MKKELDRNKENSVFDKYSLLVDLFVIMCMSWYFIYVLCEKGYGVYFQVGIIAANILIPFFLYNLRYSNIFSTHQRIIDNRLYTSRLRKIVYRQRRNYFLVFCSILILVIFLSCVSVAQNILNYSIAIYFFIGGSIAIIMIMYYFTTKKFIRNTNSTYFKNYKIAAQGVILRDIRFIVDIWKSNRDITIEKDTENVSLEANGEHIFDNISNKMAEKNMAKEEMLSEKAVINQLKIVYDNNQKLESRLFECSDSNTLVKLYSGIPFDDNEYFRWILTRESKDRLYNKAYDGKPTSLDLCLFMIYLLEGKDSNPYQRSDNKKIIYLISNKVELNGRIVSLNTNRRSYLVSNARNNRGKDTIIRTLFQTK